MPGRPGLSPLRAELVPGDGGLARASWATYTIASVRAGAGGLVWWWFGLVWCGVVWFGVVWCVEPVFGAVLQCTVP